MKRTSLQKIRAKIAAWVLGDQCGVFASKEIQAIMAQQAYLDLDNEALGAMFRHWNHVFVRSAITKQGEEMFPFRSAITSAAVLFLASEANKYAAASGDFLVDGTIDGGETTGRWAVRVEKAPDDEWYAQKETVRLEDGRISQIAMSFQNGNFDKWRAENQRRRELEETEINTQGDSNDLS